MNHAFAILETTGWTPAIAALDCMDKAASVRVVQAELNDFLGVCIKLEGPVADLEAALAVGYEEAKRMGGRPVSKLLARPDPAARPALISEPEYNPLIQQAVVSLPESPLNSPDDATLHEDLAVSTAPDYALGLLETQGFTAVFAAIDQACKAANVEVVGKEKLGGGYVTVVIKGDVAAVKAAIDAGQAEVGKLGTLIAAHVIPRPSPSVISLLPK